MLKDVKTPEDIVSMVTKKAKVVAVAGLSLGILATSVARVPANAVGVKVSSFTGVSNKTYPTKWYLKVPFFDQFYILSTQTQTVRMSKITTQTKDGQWLNTDIDVKYKVEESNAMEVFKNYTNLENVNERAIQPAVQRAIESVTGEYDIYEILGEKRTEVYGKIDEALKKRFSEEGLKFTSFTITDQDAGDEIESAIKAESVKQKEIDTAKQEQEKAKVEAETAKVKAQAEADAKVIKAQGEADANNKLNASLTDNIIRMKEAEARLKHGWVEVQTGSDVIVDNSGN